MLKSRILCLLAVGFLVGAVKSAAGEKAESGPMKLACGLLVIVALFYPLTEKRMDAAVFPLTDYTDTLNAAIDARSQADSEALQEIVCRQCEAYVVSEAAKQGVTLTAHVECRLREDKIPVPQSCTLTAAEPVPQALVTLIADSLGLEPEQILLR